MLRPSETPKAMLLSSLFLAFLAIYECTASSQTSDVGAQVRNLTGMPCELKNIYQPVPNFADQFYKCMRISGRAFPEWTVEQCPRRHIFSMLHQNCSSKSTVRRQQAGFVSNTVGICGPVAANAAIGTNCQWMSAQLQNCQQPNNYYQCVPQAIGSPCGVWQQQPCAPGTQFNQQLQVCTQTQIQASCPSRTVPICPCGPSLSCPSASTCIQGTCCCNTVTPPVLQRPRCPDGSLALSVCQTTANCASGYTCQNGGCCPSPLPICANGEVAAASCVTSAAVCAAGYECRGGGCCRIPQCPSGLSGTQYCLSGGICPPKYGCQNGACCILPTCPIDKAVATEICSGVGQGSCVTGFYCAGGGCCALPRCSNGMQAQAVCTDGGECPAGTTCINSGCCPLPSCPIGGTATKACEAAGECESTEYCYINAQGLKGCCPVPTCPSGVQAKKACTGYGQAGCDANERCENGGCCSIPLPTCPAPNTVPAVQYCTGNSCPDAHFCYAIGTISGCCPLPKCPNGGTAVQVCTNGCPLNHVCYGGGCCPLPTCSNGQVSLQACSPLANTVCPRDYQCQNGGCCFVQKQLPMCPDGTQSVQICTIGTVCPSTYQCLNGGCCIQQTVVPIQPTCPVQPCVQPVAPIIQPTCQQPVCQCAQMNNACPYGSGCQQGTCCANSRSAIVARVQVPGSSCTASNMCGGYPVYAACVNGYCSCVNNARSDGLKCTVTQINYRPGISCNQFGQTCGYLGYRRKPSKYPSEDLRKADMVKVTEDTKPEFWEPLSNVTHCHGDQDCTPNKICLNRTCHLILQPGDRGCVSDLQCLHVCDEKDSLCPKTSCVPIRDGRVRSTICNCGEAYVVYDGNCVPGTECPKGTKMNQGECVDD